MIGTKSKTSSAKNNGFSANGASSAPETCIIAAGTAIEGKFSSEENVRIDGKIKGEVKCSRRLVMGQSGRIEGNVLTEDATIMGTIEGELRVTGSLHLQSTAYVKGTIVARNMAVDEGARYMGDCRIGEKQA
ncbi:MAG: polymer-forming cytoskeletal protein [Saprospiraceae bacterium]